MSMDEGKKTPVDIDPTLAARNLFERFEYRMAAGADVNAKDEVRVSLYVS